MALNADWHDDSIAKRVSWKPLIEGGFSFSTHRLHRRGSRLFTYVTGFAQFFHSAFVFLGIFFPTAMLVFAFNSTPKGPGFSEIIFLLAIMAIFTSISVWMLRAVSEKCLYFDRESISNSQGVVCRTSDVYAIQLLTECVANSGAPAPFDSHELNLVLKDCSRINVTDHAIEDIVRHDARLLSRYLDVPIWDAAGGRRGLSGSSDQR